MTTKSSQDISIILLADCFYSEIRVGSFLGQCDICWVVNTIRFVAELALCFSRLVEVLLYVHRNRRLIRDGSPGRPPPLLHSSSAHSVPQFSESHFIEEGEVGVCEWVIRHTYIYSAVKELYCFRFLLIFVHLKKGKFLLHWSQQLA